MTIKTSIYLLILLLAFRGAGYAAPYERCDWRNKDFTDRLVDEYSKSFSKTEACMDCIARPTKTDQKAGFFNWIHRLRDSLKKESIPVECFFASASRAVPKLAGPENYYYCKSKNSRKNFTRRRLVDSKGKKRTLYPRQPCLSRSYALMTHEAFHYMTDCFDFSKKEKDYLFALFNHESSFILNNKSHSGARCYGQLTRDAVKDINKNIYLNSKPGNGIYRKALQKCADLNDNIFPLKILPADLGGPKGKRTHGRFKKTQEGLRVTCRLTQDPSACFFYSLYHIKNNMLILENNLSKTDKDVSKKAKISGKIKKDFLFPIQINEALYVKGTVTINGKKQKINWVLKDNNEVYKKMRAAQYNPQDLEIKKSQLFQFDRGKKWDILYWMYNGGASVASKYLSEFIREEKKALFKKCGGPARCENGERVRQGHSWPFDTKKFKSYLQSNYRKGKAPLSRRKEVGEFVSNVKKDMRYLQNSNSLKSHLERLHHDKEKPKPHVKQSDIDEFARSIGDRCPKMDKDHGKDSPAVI